MEKCASIHRTTRWQDKDPHLACLTHSPCSQPLPMSQMRATFAFYCAAVSVWISAPYWAWSTVGSGTYFWFLWLWKWRSLIERNKVSCGPGCYLCCQVLLRDPWVFHIIPVPFRSSLRGLCPFDLDSLLSKLDYSSLAPVPRPSQGLAKEHRPLSCVNAWTLGWLHCAGALRCDNK